MQVSATLSDDSNQLFFFQFDATSNIYCNLLVPNYCFLIFLRLFLSISTAHDSYKIVSMWLVPTKWNRTWQNSTSHRLEELNEKRLRNMHHQNDLDQAGSVLLDASGKWWTRKGQKKRVFLKSNQIPQQQANQRSRTPKDENLWQTCWLDILSSKNESNLYTNYNLKTNQVSCSLTCWINYFVALNATGLGFERTWSVAWVCLVAGNRSSQQLGVGSAASWWGLVHILSQDRISVNWIGKFNPGRVINHNTVDTCNFDCNTAVFFFQASLLEELMNKERLLSNAQEALRVSGRESSAAQDWSWRQLTFEVVGLLLFPLNS